MNLVETNDYREFIKRYIKKLPKNGKGELSRLAMHMHVQPSMISQILNKKKKLNLEQASKLCAYFKFTNAETDYFLLLVQRDRAGTKELTQILDRQIEQLRIQLISTPASKLDISVVSDQDRHQFYSAWYYSGIRLLTALDGYSSIDSISTRFDLSYGLVEQVVDFLINTGLCEKKNDKIKIGPMRTHLSENSSSRIQHHTNWRAKSLSRISEHTPPEFFYSFPMAISKNDIPVIRELVLDLVQKIDAVVKRSNAEELVCLNIDWFRF